MMDFFLETWMSSIIEGKKIQWMMGKREPWTPGEKLRLLFAGYNGTRNTGSDVRVEEMLRQIRRILGPENVDLSMMTFNFDRSRGLRRFDVQIEVRQFTGNDDDWFTGHCGRGEQVIRWLWRRSGTDGSARRQDVRPLLQEFAGNHAQQRVAEN